MILAALLSFFAEVDLGSAAQATGGTVGLALLGWIVREIRSQRDGVKTEIKAELKNEKDGTRMHVANQPLEVREQEKCATVKQLASHAQEDAAFHESVRRDFQDLRELLQEREDRMHERVNRLTEKVGELTGVIKSIMPKGGRS